MADSVTKTSVDDRLKRQQELHMAKTQNSMKEFKNARVTSCSGVLARSGQTVALAFPMTNSKVVDLNALKSSETTSFAQ